MFLVKDVGKFRVEWAMDETIPGPHPKCTACHKVLLKEHERIVLRREQVNTQGIREGIFFCASCTLEIVKTINWLLEEGE